MKPTQQEIIEALSYSRYDKDQLLAERIKAYGIQPHEVTGEPVAWMQTDLNGKLTNLFYNNVPEDDYHAYTALYTTPPNIEALIAEIDEWGYRVGGKPDIKEIVDKYRGGLK